MTEFPANWLQFYNENVGGADSSQFKVLNFERFMQNIHPHTSPIGQGMNLNISSEQIEASTNSSKGKKGKAMILNDTNEVNSPSKASHKKFWTSEYTDFLIGFLVDQIRGGKKIDKGFKRPVYVEASNVINAKFNESFTPENVINHFRSLKRKWSDICACRDLSGSGWDEDTKTITLEPMTALNFFKRFPLSI